MKKLLSRDGSRRFGRRPGTGHARRPRIVSTEAPVRPRPDDAGLHPRPRTAPGPLRRGARLAPGRVRHRRPPRRPPHHGPRGHGRAGRRRERGHPRARLAGRPRARAAHRRRRSASRWSPSPAPRTCCWPRRSPAASRRSRTPPASPRSSTSRRSSSRWGRASTGAGTETIVVEGLEDRFPAPAAPHAVLADRIEAGTYATAAAITGGDVTLRGAREEDLGAPSSRALRAAGADVDTGDIGSSRVPRRPAPPGRRRDRPAPRLPDRPAGAVRWRS